MSQHEPSKPFLTREEIMLRLGVDKTLALMPGDKLQPFDMEAAELESAMRIAEMNTGCRSKISMRFPQPESPKKKDPRTVWGWAIKAFID